MDQVSFGKVSLVRCTRTWTLVLKSVQGINFAPMSRTITLFWNLLNQAVPFLLFLSLIYGKNPVITAIIPDKWSRCQCHFVPRRGGAYLPANQSRRSIGIIFVQNIWPRYTLYLPLYHFGISLSLWQVQTYQCQTIWRKYISPIMSDIRSKVAYASFVLHLVT